MNITVVKEKNAKMINEYSEDELVTSLITQVELYSVYSRVMKISDVGLEALVLYTLEKTGVNIKELNLDELFERAMEYANKLKLRTLDLLHITAAYLAGCKSFLTFVNDIIEHAEIIEKNIGIKNKHIIIMVLFGVTMRMVLRIHKKGILIIPKRIREAIGFEEDSEVIAEVIGNSLVLRPLKPRIVDVDPRLVDELLREEYELEKKRYRRTVFGGKDGSRYSRDNGR